MDAEAVGIYAGLAGFFIAVVLVGTICKLTNKDCGENFFPHRRTSPPAEHALIYVPDDVQRWIAQAHWRPEGDLFSQRADEDQLQAVVDGTVERFIGNMEKEKPVRFSPKQLASFTQEYSIRLGSGGFGVVYRGQFPNGIMLAVKVLNDIVSKTVVENQFMAEVSTIGRTYHKNLVRLYGFCYDFKIKALVYEYLENGSLDRILFGNDQKISWSKLYGIAIGTAKGLLYLHEDCRQRIIHYDIKPGNVLLDSNFCPKVADFGLAKFCNKESHVSLSGGRGTPGYAAPELWMPFPVTYKCDVYSFGMMLFEIVGRRRNFEVNQSESQQWFPRQVWDKFDGGKLSEMIKVDCKIEDDEDKEKAEVMCMVALWCVQYLPEARPSMRTVLKILEGGTQIPVPPNPFQHLMSSGMEATVSIERGRMNSSNGGSDFESSFGGITSLVTQN